MKSKKRKKVTVVHQYEIESLSDPSMTIGQWMGELLKLVKTYGVDAVLKADAGHNNVSMIVETEGV